MESLYFEHRAWKNQPHPFFARINGRQSILGWTRDTKHWNYSKNSRKKTSFGPLSRGYWQNWSTEQKKGSKRPKSVSPSENIAIVANISAVVNQRKWSKSSSDSCAMSLCLCLNEKFCCFRSYDYSVILKFSFIFLKLLTLFLTILHKNYCTAKSDPCFTFIFGL